MCSVSLHFIGWQIYCNWGIKYCGNQIYLLGRPLAAKLQVLAIFEQKVAPCVEWYLRSSLRCSSVIIVLTRGHMPQIIITHSHHYMETCHMGGRRGARAANDPSVFTISWLWKLKSLLALSHILTNQPIPYDLCVGIPILHLLTTYCGLMSV